MAILDRFFFKCENFKKLQEILMIFLCNPLFIKWLLLFLSSVSTETALLSMCFIQMLFNIWIFNEFLKEKRALK